MGVVVGVVVGVGGDVGMSVSTCVRVSSFNHFWLLVAVFFVLCCGFVWSGGGVQNW